MHRSNGTVKFGSPLEIPNIIFTGKTYHTRPRNSHSPQKYVDQRMYLVSDFALHNSAFSILYKINVTQKCIW